MKSPCCSLPVESVGHAAAEAARAQQLSGLVPSITSPNSEIFINLDRGACAERRINRMRKSVWCSGSLHSLGRSGHRPDIPWFVTLTYAQEDAWEADHISEAMERFRRWCKSNGYPCRYTWVAEIQPQRAQRTGKHVVHYHLLAWLPRGVLMPKWDVSCGRRLEFWSHGMTNTQIAKAGIGYLMKYLSKIGEFTEFPKGLRLSGTGGLNAAARAIRCWINFPEWAKCAHGVGDLVRKSGRLVVQATGEVLKSPYLVSRLPGGLLVLAVAPVPERFHSGPYSSLPGGTA